MFIASRIFNSDVVPLPEGYTGDDIKMLAHKDVVIIVHPYKPPIYFYEDKFYDLLSDTVLAPGRCSSGDSF